MQTTKIEISAKTIIFAVLFILFLNFLWVIRDLLFSLFIALIIVSALKPAVSFLVRVKLPRILAAIVVYILFLGLIVYLLSSIFPPLITESTHLFRSLPYIIQSLSPQLTQYVNVGSFTQFIPNITNQFFSIVGNVFSNTLFVITTIFFGFYLLLEENAFQRSLSKFLPRSKLDVVIKLIERVEKRMSGWFWGEVLLMTVVGLLTFIGLNIIGTRYALALAVLAGLLEIIPNFGPILSAVPAILIGLSQSYFLGFANLALYFIVQQLENHIVVPAVMKKTVGLSPVITLMSLIVGGKIAGTIGILLAIPFTLFLETVLVELSKAKSQAR